MAWVSFSVRCKENTNGFMLEDLKVRLEVTLALITKRSQAMGAISEERAV